MTDKIEQKLAELPKTPGVYFHKDADGQIIYIGKAANLRNRVRQYFQKSRLRDTKTDLLVADIADIDWIEVESEADALFLEAEQVRRNMPKYNILLRDDKSQLYVRIDYKSDYPTVTLLRRPLDDGARYFGPYLSGPPIRRALRYLRKAFPYAVSRPAGAKRANLYYHLGLDPGLEEGRTSLNEYRKNLRRLMGYLTGDKATLLNTMEREMQAAAKKQDYEHAAILRNQLKALEQLNRQILFSDRELLDISKDQALSGLAELLGLSEPPRRIEGFDISHQQGSDTVASMVVFSSGLPDKAQYRKFKMRIPGNDDFIHMHEVIHRRLSQKNRDQWGLPSLFLIDGGKGQLSSAIKARTEQEVQCPMVALAKREEEIIVSKQQSLVGDIDTLRSVARQHQAIVTEGDEYISILLPKSSAIVKLLQRIRDESHRFAVSYHSVLKRGRQTTSLLDEIPGIGPATRKKLIKEFGSKRAVAEASLPELTQSIGQAKGKLVYQYLKESNPQ